MDHDGMLALFDDLATEIGASLSALDDWGPSGERPTQYRHDVVADRIIVPRLLDAGLAVLSEESGLLGDGEVVVVVDPVDGSTNGSLGLPWYATSLCAVDEAGPLVSLVANLASGERFRAIRGGGVEVVGSSGDRRAGPGPTGCLHLDQAVIGVSGLPPAHGGWAQFRALGAAALDLCAVAVGRLDAYLDLDRAHGVWDYLGAWLVCVEAGAPIVDSGGEDLVVLDPAARRGPIAAATPELLIQLESMLRSWRVDGLYG